MEWLVSFLPIGLILFACVGMHFFMMRGMHGGHGDAGGNTRLGAGDAEDRVAQLESQVNRLQQQLDASREPGSTGVAQGEHERVHAAPVSRRGNGAHGEAGGDH